MLFTNMKSAVFFCALIYLTHGKVLPDYVSNLICRKSDPKYEECILRNIEKARPRLLKGIPELSMPGIDPFELPVMTVDRTINDLVSIKAVTRNIRMTGAGNMVIEHLKANPTNLTGEIRVTLPWTHLEMDYDVNGQLLIIPLRSKGFFSGNFTDTQIYVKGNVKTVDKNGVKYFRVDKLAIKARVGDGRVKLTAENPDLQFGADLIANFYNENPRQVMDAINPIFVETATELYRVVLDQILGSVPAKEWLPE